VKRTGKVVWMLVKLLRHQISDIYEALISIAEDDTLNVQSGTKTKFEAKSILYKISSFCLITGY